MQFPLLLSSCNVVLDSVVSDMFGKFAFLEEEVKKEQLLLLLE